MRNSDAGGNFTSRVNSRGSRMSFSIGSRNSTVTPWAIFQSPPTLGLDDYFAAHPSRIVEKASVEIGSGLRGDDGRRMRPWREISRAPCPRADLASRLQRVVGPSRVVRKRRFLGNTGRGVVSRVG